MTQSEQPDDSHNAGPITPPAEPAANPPPPASPMPEGHVPPPVPPPIGPAPDFVEAIRLDEVLAKEGTGFISVEPEVAAAHFGEPESLVRAAFVMKGRMRLSEDEMRSALGEIKNREV